jgi:multicomponent Na+:H+ antiporter subunit F
MPDLVFYVATVWTGLLLAGAAGVLVRARSPFVRILAVDTMLLLVVGFVLVLATERGDGVFLDAAIALALLGFTTTVALVRIEREGAGG